MAKMYRLVLLDNDAEFFDHIDIFEDLYNDGYVFDSEFSPGTRFTFAVFKLSNPDSKEPSTDTHEETL